MADFKWEGNEDQVFDDSYGGNVTLTQGPYDKDYGRKFILNTKYTLKLTGSHESQDNNGRWQGDFQLLNGRLEVGNQESGEGVHIGLDGSFSIRSEFNFYGFIQFLDDLGKFQLLDDGVVSITYNDARDGVDLNSNVYLEDNSSMDVSFPGTSSDGYDGLNLWETSIQVINNATLTLQLPAIRFHETSTASFVLGGFKNEDGNYDVSEKASITIKQENGECPIDFSPGVVSSKGIFDFKTINDDGIGMKNKGQFIIYGVTSGMTLANLKAGGYVSINGVAQEDTSKINYDIYKISGAVVISLK